TTTPPTRLRRSSAGSRRIRASTCTSLRPRRHGSTWLSAFLPRSPKNASAGALSKASQNWRARSCTTSKTITPTPSPSSGQSRRATSSERLPVRNKRWNRYTRISQSCAAAIVVLKLSETLGVTVMYWSRWYSFRSYIRSSLWIVPFIALLLYLGAIRAAYVLDIWIDWTPLLPWGLSGTQKVLETIITILLTFIVFTFGSLLVAIQIAGGQL